MTDHTNWKLIEVGDVECTLDDSGLYVVINRIETTGTHKGISGVRVTVRADLMSTNREGYDDSNDEPVMSFVGKANDVRKALIAYMALEYRRPHGSEQLSSEHASYIGWELHRAETTPGYVQD